MIGTESAAEEASRARVRCAWGKFRELVPIVTSRSVSLNVTGKVYRACVKCCGVWQCDMANEDGGYTSSGHSTNTRSHGCVE
jgi:hypothetical protein